MKFTGFRIVSVEHHRRKHSEELGNDEAKDGRKDTGHGLPLGKTLDNVNHSEEGNTTDCILKCHKQGEHGDRATTQGQIRKVLGLGQDKCNLLEHLWRALDQGVHKMHGTKHEHTLTATFHRVKDEMVAELSFPNGKRIRKKSDDGEIPAVLDANIGQSSKGCSD